MKRAKAIIITLVLIMAETVINQGFQNPPGGGKSLIGLAISESAEEREDSEMAKTTDRQIVNGETYLIKDSTAREAISEEVTAREDAVAAEATAREAVSEEVTDFKSTFNKTNAILNNVKEGWTKGEINSAGQIIEQGIYRNIYTPILPKGSVIAVNTNAAGLRQFTFVYYDDNYNFIERTNFSITSQQPNKDYNLRIQVALVNPSSDPVDIETVLQGINIELINYEYLNKDIRNVNEYGAIDLRNANLFVRGAINNDGTLSDGYNNAYMAIRTKDILSGKTILQIGSNMMYKVLYYTNGIISGHDEGFTIGNGKSKILDYDEYRIVIASSTEHTPGNYTVQDTINQIEKFCTGKYNQILTNSMVLESQMARKICHYSFDDVWLLLKDLTINASTYESIFDNAFLASLKHIHDTYGLCVSLFTFNQHSSDNSYSISNVPNNDTFKAEFYENRNWLKFGFHGKSDTSNYNIDGNIEEDYAIFVQAIYKLTGTTECIDSFTRLSNFGGSEENIIKLINADYGITGLLGSDGIGENDYYLSPIEKEKIKNRGMFVDGENGIIFIRTINRNNFQSDIESHPAYQKFAEAFSHEYESNSIATCDGISAYFYNNGYTFDFPSRIFK